MIFIFFITIALSTPDPNAVKAFEGLCEHWLEPMVDIQVNPNSMKLIGPVKRYPDGSWVRISSLPEGQNKRPLNLLDFVWISQHWPGEPPKYYLCLKCKDNLYHVAYPGCSVTKGYKMEIIQWADLKKYQPCKVCLPELSEPNLIEILKNIDDPNVVKTILEVLK